MPGIGDRAKGIMDMLGFDLPEKDDKALLQAGAMPPQQMPPPQQEGGSGMGVGNIMGGLSNSLFKGMSQEEVYRMGQGFNTLRFEPDDRMAANFESRIAKLQSDKKTTETTNATIKFLKDNKRDDLAEMVESGIYTAATAVDVAMTVTKDPEWLQKLKYTQQIIQNGPTGTIADIPKYMHGLLDIETEQTPEFIQRMTAIANPPKDANGVVIPWTPEQLETGFGIAPDDGAILTKEFEAIDSLAKLDPETYTADLVTQMKLKKLGVLIEEPADSALPNAVGEYEYYKTNTKDNPPMSFKAYKLLMKGGGTDIEITMPGPDVDKYADLQTTHLVNNHNTLVDGIDTILQDIRELHKMQNIIDEAEDGTIKFGMLEPLYTKASQFAESIGLTDGNQATKIQLMKSAFGAGTFKMLKILGLGTKGIDTVPERIFLQESYVGDTKMTKDQLQIMTQQRLDILTQAVEKYNSYANERTEDGLNSAYFKNYEQFFSTTVESVEVPLRAGAKKTLTNETVSKYF